MSDQKVRLSKRMSELGICSRREADELIVDGLVLVDGEVQSELGVKVFPHQTITLAKEAQKHLQSKVTILLNKPVGYVSNLPEKGYPPALSIITKDRQDPQFAKDLRLDPGHLMGLACAGRLDIDSKGLLVLTQDGRVAKQLVGENSNIEKEYVVWYEGSISDEAIEKLRFGLALDGKPLKLAKIQRTGPGKLQFILREGRKRQIRRMCELVSLKVTGLKRVRVGKIQLGGLQEGMWRFLKEGESF